MSMGTGGERDVLDAVAKHVVEQGYEQGSLLHIHGDRLSSKQERFFHYEII
jgi:hypothetical protein